MVFSEDVYHGGVKAGDMAVRLVCVEVDEMPCEFGQIFCAFSERGDDESQSAYSVVDVLSEASLGDFV
jgi:hypothetical protein